MIYELYAFLDWISLQCTPFTAQLEYLEAWANLKGVYRLPASSASGTVMFTGTGGTPIPVGSILTRSDGAAYATLIDWQVGSILPLTFRAVVPGQDGNAPVGVALSLSSPIVGITSPGVASAITGGADIELDDSLRSRMLAVYAAPPSGGSQTDFINWALSSPGVTRAWVFSQGTTPGSVLVYIMLDQAESATNGFPVGTNGGATNETRLAKATGDQLNVANLIFPLQPITSLVQVSAPVAKPIAFNIQNLNPPTAVTQANVNAALIDMFARLGAPLASSLIYPSDVNAAIESAAGVISYTLLSPVTPITTTNGYLPVLGAVTYS